MLRNKFSTLATHSLLVTVNLITYVVIIYIQQHRAVTLSLHSSYFIMGFWGGVSSLISLDVYCFQNFIVAMDIYISNASAKRRWWVTSRLIVGVIVFVIQQGIISLFLQFFYSPELVVMCSPVVFEVHSTPFSDIPWKLKWKQIMVSFANDWTLHTIMKF